MSALSSATPSAHANRMDVLATSYELDKQIESREAQPTVPIPKDMRVVKSVSSDSLRPSRTTQTQNMIMGAAAQVSSDKEKKTKFFLRTGQERKVGWGSSIYRSARSG